MQQTKILVRLPNWLGDLVMSSAFIKALRQAYPNAIIDVIVKKGIHILLDYFPPINKQYLFSKNEYSGIRGAYRFGKEIAAQEKYDLFFCLPNSFSSALMGFATGAKKRVGYKAGLRNIFLTHTLSLPKNIYHVDEYIELIKKMSNATIDEPKVALSLSEKLPKSNAIIININSEAQSRRWPEKKAISIISTIRKVFNNEIILVGSDREKPQVDAVYNALPDKTNISNLAGKSPIPLLVKLMESCQLVLSSESGPAQIANALGTPTLITLGASDELLSTPQPNSNIRVVTYGQLPCQPCKKNMCSKYPQPECLIRIDEMLIVEKIKNMLTP
ncbi:MAG: glycosyltransferase family 9 protein [Bacteroidetes bacterium]|nr:glycosyltransferase family 9 protein [Bacteroidota bacterium]MBS1756409.1 glycosyltransferase family 9 protein [Bacteroidota bacterium]